MGIVPVLLVNIWSEHRLDCEYFLHLFYFPHERELPGGFFDNLIGVLGWGLTGMTLPTLLSFFIYNSFLRYYDLLGLAYAIWT